MVYVNYMLSELRRRRGRTFLTALGLAVGVGLVVTVSALSAGLDRAQEKVLKPLTGVGTDMSVTRPISFSSSGQGNPLRGLSAKEREQLRAENGARRLDFRQLTPGSKFSRDDFTAAAQLSFPSSKVTQIASLAGVNSAAGGLTLNATHITGEVRVLTGGGSDVSSCGSITVDGTARWTTGAGDDVVSLSDSTFNADVKISTGSGDDTISLPNTTVAGDTDIDSGSGNDTEPP